MAQVAPYTPSQDEKMTAMLAHVLQIFAWFLGPLVIYLTKRDSRFVAFHAIQALLLQGLWIVMGILITVLWFGAFILIAVAEDNSGPGSKGPRAVFFFVIVLIWIGAMTWWLITLVLGILYGVKAVNGEWSEYPLIGRWARRWVGIAPPQNPRSPADTLHPSPT